jgi:hypothetical protein
VLAEGDLLAVPEPKASALCVLALRLPGSVPTLTILNFGRRDIEEELDPRDLTGLSDHDLRGRRWTDLLTGRDAGKATAESRLMVRLPALSGTTLVLDEKKQ